MKTALIVAAVALMSGCYHNNMRIKNSDFDAESRVDDPILAAKVAGDSTTKRYDAETKRLVASKMVDKGMNPTTVMIGGVVGYGNGVYGLNGGLVPVAGEGTLYYRGVTAVQSSQPGRPVQTVGNNAGPDGGYATKKELEKVEEKADDSICLQWLRTPDGKGKDLSECPVGKNRKR